MHFHPWPSVKPQPIHGHLLMYMVLSCIQGYEILSSLLVSEFASGHVLKPSAIFGRSMPRQAASIDYQL